jgi:hypothetical protein
MIFCHIVGINNKLKDNFIKQISSLSDISDKIDIIDLDNISKKILFNKDYSVLYNQYINKKDKDILTKLGQIWKHEFTNDVNLLLQHNKNKQIILIGLITFYLDYRIKISFNEEIKNKFFLNINTTEFIKDNIEYNINNFKQDIILGKFPLKYLDYNFIKIQRENLREQYMTKDYKLKNYDAIINWIKYNIKNLSESGELNPVYVASYKRYENKMDYLFNNMIGYKDKWIALASMLPKSTIKKGIGYKDNKIFPILKELSPNAFTELNKCCYLYEFYPDTKIDEYRYIINNKNFNNRYYISNIKNELNLYNVFYQKYLSE